MTDIALAFDPVSATVDLALDGAALRSEDGLATAVALSVFSDARAEPGQRLPDESDGDLRGWWGDAVPPIADGDLKAGDRLGSLLWLFCREKQTEDTRRAVEDRAKAALAWMVEDGIAVRVEVQASFPRPGWLALAVKIHRPDAPALAYAWQVAWRAQAGDAAETPPRAA